MATNYPGSLDSTAELPNVGSTNELDDAGFFHDVIHLNVNQAAIALQAKLGIGSSPAASAPTGSVLHHTINGATSWRKRIPAHVRNATTPTTGVTTTETTINGSTPVTGLRLSLPGTTGSYASTPDAAAVSPTGPMRIEVQFLTWDDAAANQRIIDKDSASASARGWYFWRQAADQQVIFQWSSDGTAGGLATSGSGAAMTYMAAGMWLAVELVADGGGKFNALWYTSPDGETWTLRETDSALGNGVIFDNTEPLRVGATYTGGSNAAYDIGTVRLYKAGTLTADLNPARDAILGNTTITSSVTGEVWTLNGSAVLAATSSHTLTANHRYRISWQALIRSTAANDAFVIRVKNGATVLRQQNFDSMTASRYKTYRGEFIYTPNSTGSHTITLTIQRTAGGGTLDVLVGVDYPVEVTITDEGRI